MKLRKYQEECLQELNSLDSGNYIISLATGLGKTVVFTEFLNNIKGRGLILSHREELVNQPLKYIIRSSGVEMAKYKSNGEDIISACVPSLVKRLNSFKDDDFEVIVIDEAHHCAARSYQKIVSYFKPRLLIGVTATVNRNDGVRLDNTFDKIIYEKNLRWGIENKYLSNIYCKRFSMDYDLRKVKIQAGDYSISQLENEMNTDDNAKAIAKIYKEHAIGSTLIFGVSVNHCESISNEIKDSVLITAKTKNRASIINRFTDGEIKCLVNCQIFTEGTDIPRIETIIIARPTKNVSLYQQMVGRALRLYPGKEKTLLIDCVGVSNLGLCSAPSLLGIEYDDTNVKSKELEADLFDLPEIIEQKMDTPDYWKINYKIVDLWAKSQNYQLHNVNYFKMSDGSLVLKFKKVNIKINPVNELGLTKFKEKDVRAQWLFDNIYKWLEDNHNQDRYIWDTSIMKKWGNKPSSFSQRQMINKMIKDYDTSRLTKIEASSIINKLLINY